MSISTAAPAATAAPAGETRRITSSEQRRRISSKTRDRMLAVATPLALIAAWEVAAQAAWIDTRFFPAPTAIFDKFLDLATTGELWSHIAISMRRLAIGFVVGVVPGLLLGVAMGLFRPVRAAIKPLISGTYPIPKSALLPLILLIFGLGEASKVAMVAIGVFYPVALNALTGVAQVAPIYYDVSKNFRASRWQTFRTVAVPGAMPSIVTGVELGAGLGLILIAIAEMVGAQSGLGFMIWNAWQLYSVETMYVGLVIIAIIGYAISVVISYLGRLVTPWEVSR